MGGAGNLGQSLSELTLEEEPRLGGGFVAKRPTGVAKRPSGFTIDRTASEPAVLEDAPSVVRLWEVFYRMGCGWWGVVGCVSWLGSGLGTGGGGRVSAVFTNCGVINMCVVFHPLPRE